MKEIGEIKIMLSKRSKIESIYDDNSKIMHRQKMEKEKSEGHKYSIF